MTDTIELLEAIGSDASLRHARAAELKGVLEQVQADAELVQAVELGDGAPLRVKLGIQQAPQAQQTHAPGSPDGEEELDTPLLPQRLPPRPVPPPSPELDS